MTLKTRMEKIINNSYSNMGGIIVLKKGTTVYEKYFNDCTAATSLHVFSVTKSIISILIGIAIDKGFLLNTDQKILDFFPEYVVKAREKTIQNVTLNNLLTMTAPYKFKSEPYIEYFSSTDWVKYSLDSLGGKEKLGKFRYAPQIGPDIMSGILVNTTGRSVLDFATEYLFSPLGITVEKNLILDTKEQHLAFSKAKNVNGWVADSNGINTGGWGLTLTPMSMAKIGQLYLNEGVWNGQQIVSSAWVSESTKEHSRCNQFQLSYGYLWWIINDKERSFAAMGAGGNIIYVNPKKDLVISIASLFIPQFKDVRKLIKDYIEPIFGDQAF